MFEKHPTDIPLKTEAFVKNNFDTKIAPIFGTDGCGMNVKALICASACSPDQSTAGTAGGNSY